MPTREECLRAAAHVVLMAAIRIEQEKLDRMAVGGEAAALQIVDAAASKPAPELA